MRIFGRTALIASRVLPGAILLMLCSGTAMAQRGIAYAWDFDGNTGISPTFSLNPSGQTITASHPATGQYLVTFPGSGIGTGWDVQTHGYGSDTNFCKTGSWGGEAVSVFCFDTSGNPVNSQFTVLAISNNNDKQISFAWANQPSTASYNPDFNYAYNTSGGAITITRSSAGSYAVTFSGLNGVGGTVQITSYGPGNSNCYSNGWGGSSNFIADVGCQNAAGTPVDAYFVIAIIPAGVTPGGIGFTWANNPTAASYTPDATYTYNLGGPVQITRNSAGNYTIVFSGINPIRFAGGDVRATAYVTTNRCKVFSWGSGGDSDFVVNVGCFNTAGTAADSLYEVLVVPPLAGLSFYTLTPCRLVDTRNPVGPLGGPALVANADRTFTLAGHCGIPASAKAVSIVVTITEPTASGDLRLFPGGTPVPLASVINYRTGLTRANNALATLGFAGDLTVQCDQASGTVQLIIDAYGYYQ